MTLVEIGAVLLVLMFVLLAAGVWIGMTLAIIGGVGMVWFTTLSVGVTAKNLFTAFWNANASWELAALPLVPEHANRRFSQAFHAPIASDRK